VLGIAEDEHFASAGVCDEEVAIRRGDQKTDALELFRKNIHVETGRHRGKEALWRLDPPRAFECGLGGEGSG
jgi:hypothetical protein